MTTAFIICGALAREVREIVDRHGWDVDIVGVSALDHLFPERIPPDVETRLLAVREHYDRVIVVYGDCGTGGALDQLLDRYGVERVAGPHCYEMFSGSLVQELMDQEPGTFFLTDFLVRAFYGTVVKGLGLDRFPELVADYFRNYRRVVYLAQTDDDALAQKARRAAAFLGLPLEIRHTGYGHLEQRLMRLMGPSAAPAAACPVDRSPVTNPLLLNRVSPDPSGIRAKASRERKWRRPTRRRRARSRS